MYQETRELALFTFSDYFSSSWQSVSDASTAMMLKQRKNYGS